MCIFGGAVFQRLFQRKILSLTYFFFWYFTWWGLGEAIPVKCSQLYKQMLTQQWWGHLFVFLFQSPDLQLNQVSVRIHTSRHVSCVLQSSRLSVNDAAAPVHIAFYWSVYGLGSVLCSSSVYKPRLRSPDCRPYKAFSHPVSNCPGRSL